ncbi:MAG: FAD:protein FMN transferase [Fidelibacterota bacterium]
MRTIVLVKEYLIKSFHKTQLLLGFCFLIYFYACERQSPLVEFSGNSWGTTYTIKIVTEESSSFDFSRLKIGIDSIFISIDNQMSTYKVNSEISLFNMLPKDGAINISSGFVNVIQRSIYWSGITSGAFDITVFPAVLNWREGRKDREYKEIWAPPTDLDVIMEMEKIGYDKLNLNGNTLIKRIKGQMIDVNAIAKGWGVDQIFRYLKFEGFLSFMVEIGGEVRTIGKNNIGKNWRIGIDKPIEGQRPGESIYKVISLKNKSMATSGNYRDFYEYEGLQYSHIIDPTSGKTIQNNILSVTVTAPNCLDADVLATALNVMSFTQGLKLIESLKGYEALWIIKEDESFKSVASSGMPISTYKRDN